MLRPESSLKNEKHEILWDFEIKKDHLISCRTSNLADIYQKEEYVMWWNLPLQWTTEW